MTIEQRHEGTKVGSKWRARSNDGETLCRRRRHSRVGLDHLCTAAREAPTASKTRACRSSARIVQVVEGARPERTQCLRQGAAAACSGRREAGQYDSTAPARNVGGSANSISISWKRIARHSICDDGSQEHRATASIDLEGNWFAQLQRPGGRGPGTARGKHACRTSTGPTDRPVERELWRESSDSGRDGNLMSTRVGSPVRDAV